MSQNYDYYLELNKKFGTDIEIRNLSGLFNEVFQDIKNPLIELLAGINKEYNSFDWWYNQVASRSTPATKMMPNITYLFCVKKIFSNNYPKICFIVESNALSFCIENLAVKEGYDVTNYFNRYSLIFDIIYYKLLGK